MYQQLVVSGIGRPRTTNHEPRSTCMLSSESDFPPTHHNSYVDLLSRGACVISLLAFEEDMREFQQAPGGPGLLIFASMSNVSRVFDAAVAAAMSDGTDSGGGDVKNWRMALSHRIQHLYAQVRQRSEVIDR